MTDPEVRSTIELYSSFMEEIKTRFGAIHETVSALRADNTSPNAFMYAEFCFLQMRFVCELIALAAIAAHKPLGLNKGLLKSWHADRTFAALSKINPQCFPRGIIIGRKNGAIHVELRKRELDRADLQRIYNKCGEILHRGMIKHVLNGEIKVYDIEKLDAWARSIGQLMSQHSIMILEEGIVLLVTMQHGPTGAVQVAFAKGDGAAHLFQDS